MESLQRREGTWAIVDLSAKEGTYGLSLYRIG